MSPGAMAVGLFRVATWLHQARIRPVSRMLYLLNMVLFGCDLAPGAQVGAGLAMPHPAGTGFGHDARIGCDVRLFSGVRVGGGGLEDPAMDGMPTIGDACWLFDGAKVFGKVRLGDGAIVGANAWVTRDVGPMTIVAGSPARKVGERASEGPPTSADRRAALTGE